MRCPSCGKANAETNSYCVSCGAELKADRQKADTVERGAPTRTIDARGPTWDADDRRPERREEVWVKQSARAPSFEWFEAPEELAHGQVVIIAARWILVVAGLLLALWNPDAVGELRVQIVFILGLAVANFFLHSQLLMRKTFPAVVAYGASAADIIVISAIVFTAGGYNTILFVFYFPALLAMSVAFRTEVSYTMAAVALALYGLMSLPDVTGNDTAILITRLLMMTAVAFSGNLYWRTERDRRRAAQETDVAVEPQLSGVSETQ